MQPKRQFQSDKFWLKLFTLIIGILVIISIIFSINPRDGSRACVPKTISCDCGTSILEARSLGCKYDALAAAWLPPQCRDDELTTEFEHAGTGVNGTWSYYADREATRIFSTEEVSLLAELPSNQSYFFTTTRWHIAHCSFYWRKEFRMRSRGFPVERRYDKESHIEHCQMTFLDRAPFNETSTMVTVGLGGDTLRGGFQD